MVALATYLQAVQGQHADLLVPALCECLQSLGMGHSVFSLTKSVLKRQELLVEVLTKLSG